MSRTIDTLEMTRGSFLRNLGFQAYDTVQGGRAVL